MKSCSYGIHEVNEVGEGDVVLEYDLQGQVEQLGRGAAHTQEWVQFNIKGTL